MSEGTGYIETACDHCGQRVKRFGVVAEHDLQALRDERDRLRLALEIANETIHYYSMTTISVRAVGAKEAIKAALTPAGGQG